MAHAFTPGLRATAATRLSIRRELPIPGTVLVSTGDQVKAEQAVARAELPGELHILRIAERMGIEPHEVLQSLLVKIGDMVTPGQVLCERSAMFGLFKSRFASQVAGCVELISESNGHVAVRGPSKPLEVVAHVSGTVDSVEDGKSVTIRVDGAFVQGIFGVGGERRGRIRMLDVPPGHLLQESDIPAEIEGVILVGGTAPTGAVLAKAAGLGARGLIAGGIDDQALSSYLGYELGIALTGDEDVPMTVIITEGFGALPIAGRVSSILAALNGQMASINGATQVRAGALRPEIIVPGARATESVIEQSETQGLELGARVRLIRYPYFGALGTVATLPHETREIATGAITRVLVARLDDGREVTVPRANAELI